MTKTGTTLTLLLEGIGGKVQLYMLHDFRWLEVQTDLNTSRIMIMFMQGHFIIKTAFQAPRCTNSPVIY